MIQPLTFSFSTITNKNTFDNLIIQFFVLRFWHQSIRQTTKNVHVLNRRLSITPCFIRSHRLQSFHRTHIKYISGTHDGPQPKRMWQSLTFFVNDLVFFSVTHFVEAYKALYIGVFSHD
ncbi:hypothetical protein GOP47_0026907 [Adiantum capillus-veneris]|nr:hypothetical protein GOP47_0026907 [Adiantum capillus-veneris]